MQRTCIHFYASTPKSEANQFNEIFAYDVTDIVLN